MAQTNEEKKAKDAEMKAKQEHIEIQRKQMKEQQLKTIELEHAHAEQAREASRARSSARAYSRSSGFSSGYDEPSYFIYSGGQENQSQLTIRNSFDGETDSAEGEFDVNESTTHIRCTINGKARSGKITVKVLYPGGKVFKDLSITSSADLPKASAPAMTKIGRILLPPAFKLYSIDSRKRAGIVSSANDLVKAISTSSFLSAK